MSALSLCLAAALAASVLLSLATVTRLYGRRILPLLLAALLALSFSCAMGVFAHRIEVQTLRSSRARASARAALTPIAAAERRLYLPLHRFANQGALVAAGVGVPAGVAVVVAPDGQRVRISTRAAGAPVVRIIEAL